MASGTNPIPVIVQDGDPILHQVMPELPKELFGTEELQRMIDDMTAALDREPDGVALAANQISIPYRIFIVRYDRTLPDQPEGAEPRKPDVGVFINPSFVKSSRRRVDMDEGCLSVRGLYGTTYRHERATIRAFDFNGKKFERGGGGLLAQIFQHETDHLNGILFIDHAHDIIEMKKKRAEHAEESAEPEHAHEPAT